MPSTPRLFHLLGRWQESRLIFDALPNRPDLFKTRGPGEGESYFLINQIEHCDEGAHEHFPRAELGIFPGAELRHNRGPPEPDFYNWQPWEVEHRLLNWNLEEDVPAYAAEGEPAPMRYRRQAPPSPSGGAAAALTGKENRVGLTVQKGSRKWTFKKQYSAFAATMVNSTLAKKNVPQVRDYFQDIWKPADSWNWEMTPAAGAAAGGPYVTKITVPPFCKIFFNDVSVLQALGFDLVGVRDNASSVQIKLDRDGGPPTYFFENTGNAAKIFASTRPVANLPIYKLRALAKRERARLSQELRFTSPMIENESDELDTVWEITYVCQPPEALTFELDIEPEPSDAARGLDPYLNFFRAVLWYLCQHAGLDYEAFELGPASNDVLGLKLAFVRPNLSGSLDRFTVEISLGPESLRRMPRMRNYVRIIWNLGRTSSLVLPVLSAPLTAAERAELKRQLVEAEKRKAEAERAKSVGFTPTEEAAVVVVEGRPARPSAADVTVEEEEAAVFDPFAGRLPEEAEIEEPAAGVQEQEIAPEEEKVTVLEPTLPVKKEVATPPPTRTTAQPPPPSTKKKAKVVPEQIQQVPEETQVVHAPTPTPEVVQRVATPPPPVQREPSPPPVRRTPTQPPVVVQREPTPPPVERVPTPPPEIIARVPTPTPEIIARVPTPPPVQRVPTPPPPPEVEVVQLEEEPQVQPIDLPPPEDVEPGPAEGEDPEEEAEEEEEEEEEAEPRTPPIFQRERLRFLVGNAPRKRRWNRDENLAGDLPDGYLLVLENAEREDDFMTDYGRCCIAATVLNNRVVTKNKCFVDWQSLQQLTFQVFDSKHLSLVRSYDTQLVKIELLVFH